MLCYHIVLLLINNYYINCNVYSDFWCLIRMYCADAAGQPVPAAQAEPRREVCHVLRWAAGRRGLCPGALNRQEQSAAPAALRNRHHFCSLLHRLLSGIPHSAFRIPT